MEPQLCRIEAAASMLGLSHWTLRTWARDGRVKTVRLGKLRMVPKSEVDRIVREGVNSEDNGEK